MEFVKTDESDVSNHSCSILRLVFHVWASVRVKPVMAKLLHSWSESHRDVRLTCPICQTRAGVTFCLIKSLTAFYGPGRVFQWDPPDTLYTHISSRCLPRANLLYLFIFYFELVSPIHCHHSPSYRRAVALVAMEDIVFGVSMVLYTICAQEAPPGDQPSLWSHLNRRHQPHLLLIATSHCHCLVYLKGKCRPPR